MSEKGETLGRRIARLRLEHGMTQERLASELGVTAQAVSKWENDLSAPDISLLPGLARTFGVSVDQLLGVEPIVRAVVPADSGAAGPEANPADAATGSRDERARTLHIRIHDAEDGGDVNLNLPIGLSTLALRAGSKASGGLNLNMDNVGVDLDLLAGAISRGERGTLVEIDEPDGDHVAISLE